MSYVSGSRQPPPSLQFLKSFLEPPPDEATVSQQDLAALGISGKNTFQLLRGRAHPPPHLPTNLDFTFFTTTLVFNNSGPLLFLFSLDRTSTTSFGNGYTYIHCEPWSARTPKSALTFVATSMLMRRRACASSRSRSSARSTGRIVRGFSDGRWKGSLANWPAALPEEPPTPLWKLVLEQFKDQLVIILLASAAISFVLALLEDGDDMTAFVDPAVILAILILNSVVGVSQESSAEAAIAALNEYSASDAKVLRDGHLHTIRADDLVPGDVIDVAVGDQIPADCRVLSIHSNSFRVDQAILTGESESVAKDTKAVKDDQAVKQDQVNMLFSGTTVTVGHARALIVLTGADTAIGDIHTSITSQISEPTPLKQKLNDFGDVLAKVIMVICIVVWLINIGNFNDESHGGWVKGAIYYLKVCGSAGAVCLGGLLTGGVDCGFSRCCCYSGRSCGGYHDLPCARNQKDGDPRCGCAVFAVGGDARKLQRHLLRQNRYSYNKPDVCGQGRHYLGDSDQLG